MYTYITFCNDVNCFNIHTRFNTKQLDFSFAIIIIHVYMYTNIQ